MKRNDCSPRLKNCTNNTPTRIREINNQQHKGIERRVLSPNKLNATKKPIIKPKSRNEQLEIQSDVFNISQIQRKGKKQCSNHSERQAQFKIKIDDEVVYYCERCAVQLASQGFQVQKINSKITVNEIHQSKQKQNSYSSNVEHHPRFKQITVFLNEIKKVDHDLKLNGKKFEQIEQHYHTQIQYLESFYNQMIDYMKHVKNQHISILKSQAKKNSQISKIEFAQNAQNQQDLHLIVNDIQQNMDQIICKINEQQFSSVINRYNQQKQLLKHRIQQQHSFIEAITDLEPNDLQGKLIQYRKMMNSLLGISEQDQNLFSFESKKPIKNKTAFRNLFDSGDEFHNQK